MTSRSQAPRTRVASVDGRAGLRRRRRRSRGSRAARGRAAAARRWRAGWRPCAARPRGAARAARRAARRPRRTAPRAGSERIQRSSCAQVLGILGELGERHLVRAERALGRQAVDLLRARSSPSACAGRSSASAGAPRRPPARARWIAAISSRTASSAAASSLVDRLGLVALDEARRVAVALEQRAQLVLADPREHRRVGDLVAVEVQDRAARRRRAPDSRNLLECQLAASGPVSASPSPTTHSASRSGLSNTAP